MKYLHLRYLLFIIFNNHYKDGDSTKWFRDPYLQTNFALSLLPTLTLMFGEMTLLFEWLKTDIYIDADSAFLVFMAINLVQMVVIHLLTERFLEHGKLLDRIYVEFAHSPINTKQNRIKVQSFLIVLFLIWYGSIMWLVLYRPIKDVYDKGGSIPWTAPKRAVIDATFPGGDEGFSNYIYINKKYPEQAQTFNITGDVELSFAVDKYGSVTEVEIIKSLGYGCDEEAVRLLTTCPKWTPGTRSGRPIKLYYTGTITFFSSNTQSKTN